MNRLLLTGLLLLPACAPGNDPIPRTSQENIVYDTSGEVPPPAGYDRIVESDSAFGAWLRRIKLKKDRTVYLYNGRPKANQDAQYAVLDIPVGARNLQQCADAVMRMRAEYLFARKQYARIVFTDNAGRAYAWKGGADRAGFEKYLETVFGWCGTASLEKQLTCVPLDKVMPGDVLIRGGFPGHAMIVMDVAQNKAGERIYMLAQSYMPAQDIHIVINPRDGSRSPWYTASDPGDIVTPEWIFRASELRRFTQ